MSFFGAFQDTAVEISDLTIRTIIPPNISIEKYRKAMIVIFFSLYSFSLSSFPFVFISDLSVTVAAYFTLPTGSIEREAKRIVGSILNTFFNSDNLHCIGFLDSSGKLTLVSDLTNSVAEIIFITFSSTIATSDGDHRFPSETLPLDFLSRLP